MRAGCGSVPLPSSSEEDDAGKLAVPVSTLKRTCFMDPTVELLEILLQQLDLLLFFLRALGRWD